jgi:hypothetical protein
MLKDFLTRNLNLKLLALATAVILWILAHNWTVK